MVYTKKEIESTFQSICVRITEGESLRSVLKDKSMPGSETFFKWVDGDESRAKRYARACESRAENLFEEILDIADESNADLTIGEDGNVRVDGEAVQRSKLRVDARKWMIGKMHPKKYGDKLDVTSDGKQMRSPAIIVKPKEES